MYSQLRQFVIEQFPSRYEAFRASAVNLVTMGEISPPDVQAAARVCRLAVELWSRIGDSRFQDMVLCRYREVYGFDLSVIILRIIISVVIILIQEWFSRDQAAMNAVLSEALPNES